MKKIFKNVNYEKYYKNILPYIQKEKNQQYFAVILTLGATIFFALFAINPTLSTIVRLRKEVSDSRFAEEGLTKKVSNLSALSLEYQRIQEDLDFVLESIPNQANAPALVAQIQAVAKDSSVNLTGVLVPSVNLTTKTASKSSLFVFQVSGEGTYENINSFITKLTDMQRIVSIDKISLTKREPTSQSVDLNLEGSAYYKK